MTGHSTNKADKVLTVLRALDPVCQEVRVRPVRYDHCRSLVASKLALVCIILGRLLDTIQRRACDGWHQQHETWSAVNGTTCSYYMGQYELGDTGTRHVVVKTWSLFMCRSQDPGIDSCLCMTSIVPIICDVADTRVHNCTSGSVDSIVHCQLQSSSGSCWPVGPDANRTRKVHLNQRVFA